MTRHRTLRRLKTNAGKKDALELTPETVKEFEINYLIGNEPDEEAHFSAASLATYINQLPPQRRHIFQLNKI